jgi:dolichyl-phosphate-mannose--protein O-mannosyl transferase
MTPMAAALPNSISATTAPERDITSLPDRLTRPMPSSGLRGWIGPLAVGLIGAILRLWDLGRPHAFAFDETYYPKEALSLLQYGYERAIIDNANDIILKSDGNWQALNLFKDDPAFVVHPPLGKWTIAVGEYAFGATPFGWRISVAVLGIIGIIMLARIVRRLTRSDLIGTLAGLLLALDGIHIVMSRTGLLDMVLAFWILAAFGLLLIDRDHTRRRLAGKIKAVFADRADPSTALDVFSAGFGPAFGLRPWRWAAAIALGLACSVKWSGIWFVVAFVLMTLVWDVSARRTIGVKKPWTATVLRDAPLTGITMVAIVIVVYFFSWTGWFLSADAYNRNWAAGQPASIIPASLRSWWDYHAQAWNFHVGLTSEHAYKSNPLSWPFQTRPTSFFYESIKDGSQGCPTDNCAAEVLALGNPIIWWAAIAAIIHQCWRWIARRDWRAGAVLVGIAAGWLPWLLYLNRTIFTFYTIVYVPFVVTALAMSMGTMIGPSSASESRRRWGALAAGALLLLIVLVAWWMYPIWTGQVLPYEQWKLRMWMPTWV